MESVEVIGDKKWSINQPSARVEEPSDIILVKLLYHPDARNVAVFDEK